MAASVEVIFDIPRLEEKLIVEELRKTGLEIRLTNVKYSPLTWSDRVADLSLIRTISMHRAAYSASIRESLGVRTINSCRAILVAGDKIFTLSALRRAGIPFPESIVAFDSEAAERAGEILGYPVIDKPPIGSWGRLVTLVKDSQMLRSIVEHRELLQSQLIKTHLIQRYVSSGSRDLRILVLGGEVLGGIRRVAAENDWRSNVAIGGRTEPIRVDVELEEISLKAAEVIGGEFMGIDLFEDDGRYLVNEVNGIPEFKGFMSATGVNVPRKLAEYVKTAVKR